MKKVNNIVHIIVNFIKKVWPSVKILIKTVAPII